MSPPSSAPVVGGIVVAGERQGYLCLSLGSQWLVSPLRRDVSVVVATSGSGVWRVNSWLAGRCADRVEVIDAPGASTHAAVRLGVERLVQRRVDVALAVEDDFVVVSRRAVRDAMALARDRQCLQVCLVRQRWFAAEFAFPTMGDYLVDRRGGCRESDDVIVLDGFFTTNPSAFVPSTLSDVLADVEPSDAYDFELAVGAAATRQGLRTLVIDGRRPHVVHIGAVSTTRLRARRGPRAVVYIGVHASRARTVVARLVRQHLRRRAA